MPTTEWICWETSQVTEAILVEVSVTSCELWMGSSLFFFCNRLQSKQSFHFTIHFATKANLLSSCKMNVQIWDGNFTD